MSGSEDFNCITRLSSREIRWRILLVLNVECRLFCAGSSDPATKAAMKAITDETQQQLAAKLAKKAEFDSKYDGGGSRAVDKAGGGSDEDEEGGTAATKHADSQGKKKGKGWALYVPSQSPCSGPAYAIAMELRTNKQMQQQFV